MWKLSLPERLPGQYCIFWLNATRDLMNVEGRHQLVEVRPSVTKKLSFGFQPSGMTPQQKEVDC